jgi:hypothetical protein
MFQSLPNKAYTAIKELGQTSDRYQHPLFFLNICLLSLLQIFWKFRGQMAIHLIHTLIGLIYRRIQKPKTPGTKP